MNKLTAALQLQPTVDRGLKGRPAIRIFTIFPLQGNDLGLVGNSPRNAPYGNELSGWSIGSQLETWR